MDIGESLIEFEYGTWPPSGKGEKLRFVCFTEANELQGCFQIESQFVRPSETTVGVALRAYQVTEYLIVLFGKNLSYICLIYIYYFF